MKLPIYIPIMLGLLVLSNVFLIYRSTKEPATTTSADTQIVESIYNRLDDQIDILDSIMKRGDQQMAEDSVMIHNSDRTFRDSLREILNPR